MPWRHQVQGPEARWDIGAPGSQRGIGKGWPAGGMQPLTQLGPPCSFSDLQVLIPRVGTEQSLHSSSAGQLDRPRHSSLGIVPNVQTR